MPQIEVRAHGEVSGYFVLGTDKRGEIARFPNLITNGGLDRMGTNSDWLGWCQVGSGSTAPNVNDASLVSRVSGTNSVSANVEGAQPSEPYFTWRRKTFRFAEGAAAGNLSEIGVGWASTGSLFSRALILDSEGSPTTIVIQPDETLDVTYEFRYYPKTTDDTGTIEFTGNLGGTYDWTLRAANVTFPSTTNGWSVPTSGGSAAPTVAPVFYSGEIAATTAEPSGTASSGAISSAGYSSGSYSRSFTVSALLPIANFPGGVGAVRTKAGMGAFQIGFTPKIPKTSNDVLSIVIEHSWARRP